MKTKKLAKTFSSWSLVGKNVSAWCEVWVFSFLIFLLFTGKEGLKLHFTCVIMCVFKFLRPY